MQNQQWTATLVQLLSLALRLESEGQYNIAKIARAAADSISPLADWWRTGRHEEFGVVSIKQQVSYFASHELTHLPQIERLVRQERR